MATAWSVTNKSTHNLLSNSNRTVINDLSGAGPFSGRSDGSISGVQFIYYEQRLDATNSVNDALGLANASWAFADGAFIGGDANATGYYRNGQYFINNVQVATLAAYTAGQVLGVATNFPAGHVWYTLDGSTWNNDSISNQNPVGNVGGLTVPVGTLFPAYETFQSGGISGQWTIIPTVAGLTFQVPTGFSVPDVSAVPPFAQKIM